MKLGTARPRRRPDIGIRSMRYAACFLGLVLAAVATAQLAPNAPEDNDFATDPDEANRIQRQIEPLVAEARRTYPEARARYLKGLPPGYVFFVTTQLFDAQGRGEQVFIRVDSIEGSKITGTIANEIRVVSGYGRGDAYGLDDSMLVDWLISRPDGSEEGNLIGKFLDGYRK